jgi:hypothetical protein
VTITSSTTTALKVSTTTLPGGNVATAYAASLSASGGTQPYVWSLASGTLPPGLSLSSGGAISGQPTTAGEYFFSVQVKDSASSPQAATSALSITVAPTALAVTTTTLPSGTVNVSYSKTLTATGGLAPYSWTLASGTLPSGIALSTTGVLSGKPTAAGTFNFVVRVTDTGGQSATRSLSLVVNTETTAGRLFSADSPFNTPIPSGAALDPYSGTMVNSLVQDAINRGAKIAWSSWSVPVYWADASTPRYTVTFDRFYMGGYHYLDKVPIPDQARAASPDTTSKSGTDGHMVVIDKSTNCMYDFIEAWKYSDGWRASWANRMYITEDGIFDKGAGTRGSSFANVAGLMTPAEFAAGVIQHALMFASGVNRSGGPVFPATSSDGSHSGTQYIPEGARLRLRADFDLSPYPKYLQIIGQALKTYGAYGGDNSGGGFNLYAVDANRSDAPWRGTYPWGSTAYPTIPLEFIKNLEVLKLPSQVASQASPQPHACGTYR